MGKVAARAIGKPAADVVKCCERHLSESPNRCENLVYKAKGKLGRQIARTNPVCRGCRLPLTRVLDRISEIRKGACDFCYETKRTVAVACEGFLGVKMKICEGCASDAAAALRKARAGESDDEQEE